MKLGSGTTFSCFTFATAVNVYVDDCRCTLRCIIRYPCTCWRRYDHADAMWQLWSFRKPKKSRALETQSSPLFFSHGKIMFLEFSHWISMCPILLTGCIPVPVFPVKTTVIYSRPCIIFIIQWFTISCGPRSWVPHWQPTIPLPTKEFLSHMAPRMIVNVLNMFVYMYTHSKNVFWVVNIQHH